MRHISSNKAAGAESGRFPGASKTQEGQTALVTAALKVLAGLELSDDEASPLLAVPLRFQDSNSLPDLMTTEQLAKCLEMRPGTLCNWRVKGCGPVFTTVGNLIRYRRRDVEAWLDGRTRTSTSDLGASK